MYSTDFWFLFQVFKFIHLHGGGANNFITACENFKPGGLSEIMHWFSLNAL